MTKTVTAVYEKGIFRPTEPVELEEGTRVEVLVETGRKPASPQELAAMLKQIAATAEPTGEPEDGSINHDHYLYGAPKRQ